MHTVSVQYIGMVIVRIVNILEIAQTPKGKDNKSCPLHEKCGATLPFCSQTHPFMPIIILYYMELQALIPRVLVSVHV